MVLSMLTTALYAQDKTISGKVTSSDDGSSLPGVSVLLKGTNTGTVTDIDGVYRLTVPSDGGVLVFSFIGMKSQEVTIGSQSVIDLSMEADVTQLSEVVVTALNIPREKKTLGYATQEVTSENLSVNRNQNVNEALAGKIAGVQVSTGSGAKFGTAEVRIRGVRGLNDGNPLYIVDGTPVDNAASVNMDAVESVNVLKGAAASALYGNRARDGVIIITTKKAAAGNAQVSFNNTTYFEKVYVLPEYQDQYGGGYSQNFNTFAYDPNVHDAGLAGLDGASYPTMFADESWGPELQGQQVAQWDAWIPGLPGYGQTRPWSPNPDNVRNFFETGVNMNNNVTFSKGGEGYSLMFGYNRIDRTGVMPNTGQNRNLINTNLTVQISPKFDFQGSVNFDGTKTQGDRFEGYGSQTSNFNQWWQRQLDMDLLDKYYQLEDGTYTSWNILGPTNPNPLYWDNPYTIQRANLSSTQYERVFGHTSLGWQIIDDLKLTASLRRNTYNRNYESQVASGTLNLDDYTTGANYRREDNVEFILTYKKQWADWSLSALLGANSRFNEWRNWNMSTNGGLSVPDLYNLKASTDRPVATNSKFFKQVNSGFIQASLGWKETVFIDGSYRMDWDSALPSDNNRYGYYAISGSWVFSEHLKNQSVLSFGKLRMNYAQVGDEIGPYQISPTFAVGTPYGNQASMSFPNTLQNPNLKPAISTSSELGIELGFWQRRLWTDFAVYQYENNDEIIQVSVAPSSGVANAVINAGLTRTKGWEATIGGAPVRTGDWEWNLSFNIAQNENEIVELAPGLDNKIQNNTPWGTWGGWGGITSNLRVGEKWGTIIGRGFQRDANGNKVVDANGYYVQENDQVLGHILPRFTGGLYSNLKYKNWTFAFTIDWQDGGVMHSFTRMFTAYSGLAKETAGNNELGNPVRSDVANGGGVLAEGVFADGTPNNVRLSPQDYWKGLFALHENWLYDASFIKMREMRLGYTFPQSMLGNTVRSLNLALVAHNPWLIKSNVDGIDPSELDGNWVEGGQLPGVRSIGFDLKIGF